MIDLTRPALHVDFRDFARRVLRAAASAQAEAGLTWAEATHARPASLPEPTEAEQAAAFRAARRAVRADARRRAGRRYLAGL